MNIPIITIDGPTASGKGTIAQRIAEKLHFHYLDSGALYRLTALSAIRLNLNPTDAARIAAAAANLPCLFKNGKIFLANEDVTETIRSENVGNMASKIAALRPVRQALVDLQVRFKQSPGLVADGRDMGTVIFPEADLKIFLTASTAVRAERRYKQLLEKGISVNMTSLQKDLIERDKRDISRKDSPLVPAKDAIVLDTSALDIETVVKQILGLFDQKCNTSLLKSK